MFLLYLGSRNTVKKNTHRQSFFLLFDLCNFMKFQTDTRLRFKKNRKDWRDLCPICFLVNPNFVYKPSVNNAVPYNRTFNLSFYIKIDLAR